MDGWIGEGRREARNGWIWHALSPSSLLLLTLLLSLGFSAVIRLWALKKEGGRQRGRGGKEEKLSNYKCTLLEPKGKLTKVKMHHGKSSPSHKDTVTLHMKNAKEVSPLNITKGKLSISPIFLKLLDSYSMSDNYFSVSWQLVAH